MAFWFFPKKSNFKQESASKDAELDRRFAEVNDAAAASSRILPAVVGEARQAIQGLESKSRRLDLIIGVSNIRRGT